MYVYKEVVYIYHGQVSKSTGSRAEHATSLIELIGGTALNRSNSISISNYGRPIQTSDKFRQFRPEQLTGCI